MPWVRGKATVTIHSDGRRDVVTSDPEVVEGDKPRTLEASGSDPEVWALIRADTPGTYTVVAHFGGATALMVRRSAIALPSATFLDPMMANFGTLGEDVLLGAVRTGAAAATQFAIDTVGAMFTSLDWEFETLAAALKILPFTQNDWVRITLPSHLAAFQERFDEAHEARWAISRPGFHSRGKTNITFQKLGCDIWNNQPTLVVFGPIGDCQFIRVARLEFDGEGFGFRDGEWNTTQSAPLGRQIVAITTCVNAPGVPLALQLSADGGLRDGGINVFIEGRNRRLLSHNPKRVLGPHGFRWLKG